MGQRLIESSAKAIIKQSLDGLNESVKARAGGGTADVAEPEAPSQAAFAATVAKEVAKDILPPWVRYGLGAAVVLILIALMYILFT